MKLLKRSVTIALLLFVGATVGMLIAQEIGDTAVRPTAEVQTSVGVESRETDVQEQPPVISAPEDDAERHVTEPERAASVGEDAVEPEPEPEAVMAESSEHVSTCVVDAIYFHNTLRCRTCKTIEEMARTTLESSFPDAFSAGRIRWTAINMEVQQQYVEEYDLVKPTLVLVRTVGDSRAEWAALDDTWRLVRSEDRFADYVRIATEGFLEACP